jgi:hypothetical protein
MTPTKRVGFYVSPEMQEKLINTVGECQTNVSEFCRVAVTFYMEHLEKEAGQ